MNRIAGVDRESMCGAESGLSIWWGDGERGELARRRARSLFAGRLVLAMLAGLVLVSCASALHAAADEVKCADRVATSSSACALVGVPAAKSEAKLRIGVYDSRAVAVAFVGSAPFQQWNRGLMEEHEKAKASGDKKRVRELESEGKARQKRIHTQGFSTAPVDDLLKHIEADLPGIQEKAGVSALVSKWDEKGLAHYAGAEQVDVTPMLTEAFHPNERQRKFLKQLPHVAPISLEKAEGLRD